MSPSAPRPPDEKRLTKARRRGTCPVGWGAGSDPIRWKSLVKQSAAIKVNKNNLDDLRTDHLVRFVERSPAGQMRDAVSELLDLIEAEAVEPLGTAGKAVAAEDIAERLETKVERIRRSGDDPEGLELVEDAVAHLRAYEDEVVAPWAFEDGDGIRWFVLATKEAEVVACYTSRPFVESET